MAKLVPYLQRNKKKYPDGGGGGGGGGGAAEVASQNPECAFNKP